MFQLLSRDPLQSGVLPVLLRIELAIRRRPDLTPLDQRLYLSLFKHGEIDHSEFPTHRNLAIEIGCARSKIIPSLQRLERAKLVFRIDSDTHNPKGKRKGNYMVVMPDLLGDLCPDENVSNIQSDPKGGPTKLNDETEVSSLKTASADKGSNWLDPRRGPTETGILDGMDPVRGPTERGGGVSLEKAQEKENIPPAPPYKEREGEKKKKEPVKKEQKSGYNLSLFPLNFQTSDSFCQIWEEWEEHRREMKCPLTSIAARGQVEILTKYSIEEAIALIQDSINRGYRGIFPPGNGRQVPKMASQPGDSTTGQVASFPYREVPVSGKKTKRQVSMMNVDTLISLLEKSLMECRERPFHLRERMDAAALVTHLNRLYNATFVDTEFSSVADMFGRGADNFILEFCQFVQANYEGWAGVEPRMLLPGSKCWHQWVYTFGELTGKDYTPYWLVSEDSSGS